MNPAANALNVWSRGKQLVLFPRESGCFPRRSRGKHQAEVVQRLDNGIHRINPYPADSVVCFVNIYPLDSDLSGG